MKSERRIILSVTWILVGAVLIGLSLAGVLDDFWSGMGSGFFILGIIQVLRYFRFKNNEAYREKVETEIGDERNAFIRNKAWAWSGYLQVLIMAVGSIALRVAGQELLANAAGFTVCIILVLYWGSYLILSKKY